MAAKKEMEKQDQINEMDDIEIQQPYDSGDDKIPREHQTRAGELILAHRKFEN